MAANSDGRLPPLCWFTPVDLEHSACFICFISTTLIPNPSVAVSARYAYVVDTAPRVPVTAAGRRALVALLVVADAPPHRHAHMQADVDGCVQTTGDRAERTSYHVAQVMAAAHNDSGSAPDMHRICCGCHSSRITTGGTRHRAAPRRCASRTTTSYAASRKFLPARASAQRALVERSSRVNARERLGAGALALSLMMSALERSWVIARRVVRAGALGSAREESALLWLVLWTTACAVPSRWLRVWRAGVHVRD
jgi:hypothetical protein